MVELLELELFELPELPLVEPPLPEAPLLVLPEPDLLAPELPLVEELPVDEPPLPEFEEVDDAEAGVAARYITERTSSSMRRKMARAKRLRSTSSCPDVEYR